MDIKETDLLLTPSHINGLRLRNRIIKTATFEGMCPNGAPSAELIEHHRRIAAGGAAMTTVAYGAVSNDGRTYAHQLLLREEIVPALHQLTEAVHKEGAAACIQLAHCGYFANKKAIGKRPIGPSRVFNTYGLTFCREMTDDDIHRVEEDFADASSLAMRAGFDAVELHFGHGYLISQFLSPFTNRRKDGWGGSLDNRMRFPSSILKKVRTAVGSTFPILVKMNLRDGFTAGMDMDESLQVAARLEQGGADALILSGGFVSKTPFYMLRGGVPVREMVQVQKSWVRKVGLSLFGWMLVKTYPFEELFFLEDAKKVRDIVGLPLVFVGGICSRDAMERLLKDGFDFLAIGRALIMEPHFVRRMERGERVVSLCDHCNKCIAEMDRGGLRCVSPLLNLSEETSMR